MVAHILSPKTHNTIISVLGIGPCLALSIPWGLAILIGIASAIKLSLSFIETNPSLAWEFLLFLPLGLAGWFGYHFFERALRLYKNHNPWDILQYFMGLWALVGDIYVIAYGIYSGGIISLTVDIILYIMLFLPVVTLVIAWHQRPKTY